MAVVLAIAVLGFAVPVSGATYYATSYPYSAALTLTSSLYDAHEGSAGKGERVSFSVRTTSGGCVQVYFAPSHNIGVNFFYLTAQSQEECDPSFSRSYSAGDAGINFTIVVDSTSRPVDYHIEIDARPTSIWELVAGGALVCGLPVLIAAVIVALRGRKKRRAVAASMVPASPPVAPESPLLPPPPRD
ncbi:MAG TPA: hypothetical protein VGR51_00205 [Thermoplasmata archaeon]|nr:hypothetical protein [Thermoplasmata archaeon]